MHVFSTCISELYKGRKVGLLLISVSTEPNSVRTHIYGEVRKGDKMNMSMVIKTSNK